MDTSEQKWSRGLRKITLYLKHEVREMDFLTVIKQAIDFMEEHLLEPINYTDVAKHLYMSNYHFHRTFSMFTGITANEYIKKRRLSLAGQELIASDHKVIDIALKYGYETPESFAKAFARFHGVTPSKVKQLAKPLKSFNRLVIKIQVEGGVEMNYMITEREPFQLLAKVEQFDVKHASNPDSNAIPNFWEESKRNGVFNQLSADPANADFYGVCAPISKESQSFNYGIATIYRGGDVPTGYKVWDINTTLWAIFPCVGSDPGCIGETWDRISKEFLPGSSYTMLDAADLELYPAKSLPDHFCEIWIPVEKKAHI